MKCPRKSTTTVGIAGCTNAEENAAYVAGNGPVSERVAPIPFSEPAILSAVKTFIAAMAIDLCQDLLMVGADSTPCYILHQPIDLAKS